MTTEIDAVLYMGYVIGVAMTAIFACGPNKHGGGIGIMIDVAGTLIAMLWPIPFFAGVIFATFQHIRGRL